MGSFSDGEFLQGFFDEAGEHMRLVNDHLFRLEAIHAGEIDDENILEQDEILREMFRSFHTLKGLSGMIGLKEGSVLAHAMETALQSAQQERIPVDQQLIDRFFSGMRVFAACVETLRKPGSPVPDISAEVRSFEILAGRQISDVQPSEQSRPAGSQAGTPEAISKTSAVSTVDAIIPALSTYPELMKSLTDLEELKLRDAVRQGKAVSLVVFIPSADRATRGENVDLIRHQMIESGTLLKAVPQMANGTIRFLFLVATNSPFETGSTIADEIIPLMFHQPQVGQAELPSREGSQPFPRIRGSEPVSASVVRVELSRLNDLMRSAGDLVLLRYRLVEQISRLDGADKAVRRELSQTNQQIGRALRDLRRSILRARMVPLAETFNTMRLVVRDLARASEKDVQLVISGETTEVDKLLVERLLDPLIHLVRNAIAHGIERPEVRQAAGKPSRGLLELRATREGDHIFVDVSDDGKGIDLVEVAKKAARLGWIEEGTEISSDDALVFITRPGFSTQESADIASGRGVGLDVVHRAVRSLGGALQMTTTPGLRTTFRLRLPLTMIIMDALLVQSGDERYAIPQDMVERIVEIDHSQVVSVEGGELLPTRRGYYTLFRLDHLMNSPSQNGRGTYGVVEAAHSSFEAGAQSDYLHSTDAQAVVDPDHSFDTSIDGDSTKPESSLRRDVLVVDRVLEIREVVVHTLNDPLVAQPGIGGATELGDGRVILILDLPALLQQGRKGR